MSSIDFDINNYSEEELYQLVDLNVHSTKPEIYAKTNEYIHKYIKENKPHLYNFFIGVQNRLLGILEEDKEGSGDEEWTSSYKTNFKFLDTEYEPNEKIDGDLVNRRNYTKIVDANQEHMVLRRERLGVGQGAGVPYVQGQMNPTLRNIKKQIINIDSHHRELLRCLTTTGVDCSGFTCTNDNFTFAEKSTDFTFTLSQPIKNVLKMSVYSYEIPHSWYVFSEDYGTTRFGISGECIDISAGNYDPSGLVFELRTMMAAKLKLANVTIELLPHNNKVKISADHIFPLVFYDPSGVLGTLHDCSQVPCGIGGGKLDYNLGWLLGFRQPSYSGKSSYIGESLIDTYGFRYLFIEVNDFNHNRLNQGIISIASNREKFSYSAANRCSLGAADASSNIFLRDAGSCGKSSPPWSGPPLTASQTYIRAQTLNAQNLGHPDRYLPPVNSDILARVPVRKIKDYEILYDNWNSCLEETAREYFGPVTLKRLRVRLLNDKGYVINLNNMDFSCCLLIEHLYQY